ncbi:MAG: hypothetical protein WBD61_10200 [Desulfobulbales bacterium]
MKEDIFSRYESHSNKRLAIDVSVGKIEELFEDFDSAASYVKKDLDQDFVEYLIESVREIGGYDFVIRINLPIHVQERHRKRLRKSIKSYFRYLELLERRKLNKMLWKSFLLFCLGMFLLTISMTLKGNMEHLSSVLQELMIEGLTVAAWVSLWSAFARLIFELGSIIVDIRIFRRIASREVVFKTSNLSKTLHADDGKKGRMAGAEILRPARDQKRTVII